MIDLIISQLHIQPLDSKFEPFEPNDTNKLKHARNSSQKQMWRRRTGPSISIRSDVRFRLKPIHLRKFDGIDTFRR